MLIPITVLGATLAGVFSDAFRDWLFNEESGSTTTRNLGLVLAGLIALPLAIWRGFVAERQANAAQQSLRNERYQKGAEMLGSEALSVRLGGIYALQRLAEEYPEEYHVQIMRLFCVFASFPTEDKKLMVGTEQLRKDVQAVMDVIKIRNPSSIALERNSQFTMDLANAPLQYGRLTDAKLDHAILFQADLSNARLEEANLSNAELSNGNLANAWLWRANLTNAKLEGANLSNAKLGWANLSNAKLGMANLSSARLELANLSNAKLVKTNLSNTTLRGANLFKAGLGGANLSNATLEDADLSNAILWSANLAGADLWNADLSGANLSSHNTHTTSSPLTGLTQAQLDEARADPENPPKLDGTLDAGTGLPLVWTGG